MKISENRFIDNNELLRYYILFKSKFTKIQFNKYVNQVIDDYVPVLDIIDGINEDIKTFYDNNLKEDLYNVVKKYKKQLKYLEKENLVQGLQDTLYELIPLNSAHISIPSLAGLKYMKLRKPMPMILLFLKILQ